MNTGHRRWIVAAAVLPMAALLLLAPVMGETMQEVDAVRPPVSPDVMKWGFVAAAIVAALSALGASYAVAIVGAAAMGAVAEKPETAGRALVFVGLAEGIAIYGLIVAMMILGYLT